MEFLMSVYAFFIANQTVIVVGLLAVSELVAFIPGIEANSVFQLVVNFLKKFKPKA